MKRQLFLLTGLCVGFAGFAKADQLRTLKADEAALNTRFQLIQSAKHEILAEYYEVANDETAYRGLALLQSAAKRGVKVKLMIDNMHNKLSTAEVAAMMNISESADLSRNFEIKVFNPISSPNLPKQTARNHDKLLNIDGEAMIVGDRNVADGYFGLSKGTNYRGLDVMVRGSSARTSYDYFMKLWNENPMVKGPYLYQHSEKGLDVSACNYVDGDQHTCEQGVLRAMKEINQARAKIDQYYQQIQNDPKAEVRSLDEIFGKGEEVTVKFAYNDPTRVMSEVSDTLESQILRYLEKNTKSSLTIVTPYLFPTKRAMNTLRNLSQRGVKIRIVTNSLASTDVTVVHLGLLSIKDQFLSMGADLYEYNGPEVLHVKAAVIDAGTPNAVAMVGSFNFDRRSALINREIGVLIEGQDKTQVSTDINSFIERIINHGATQSIGNHQRMNEEKLDGLMKALSPSVAEKKIKELETHKFILGFFPDQI